MALKGVVVKIGKGTRFLETILRNLQASAGQSGWAAYKASQAGRGSDKTVDMTGLFYTRPPILASIWLRLQRCSRALAFPRLRGRWSPPQILALNRLIRRIIATGVSSFLRLEEAGRG